MKLNFPVYQLCVNEVDNSGVNYVALVDNPAIELQWQSFNEQVRFKVMDEEKHIVSGALMVANMPIYRNDQTIGEHYVVFNPATIEQIAMKFFKDGNINNVNLMHDPNLKVEGVTMFESFLVDSARGINPPTGYGNLTDGSWFGSYKIENAEVWAKVKDGTFRGFSVEGFFDYGNAKTIDQSQVDVIKDVIISGANVPLKKHRYNNIMEFLKSIIGEEAFSKLQKFIDAAAPAAPPATTEPDANKAIATDGTIIYSDKGFVEGAAVTKDSDTGKIPLTDGDYELDNALKITVQNGVIMAVVETGTPEPDMTGMLNDLTTRMAAIEAKLNGFATTETTDEKIANVKDMAKSILDTVVTLSEHLKVTTTTTPAEPVVSAFQSQKSDAVKNLQESLSKLKIN